MRWIIGFIIVALAIIGGLFIAGLIAISIALDVWNDNDKTHQKRYNIYIFYERRQNMKELIIALVLIGASMGIGFYLGRLSAWSDKTNILRTRKRKK